MMPFARTGLPVGGGAHIINAMQHNHGPSWRMVVELTNETAAYVVYPGGQSGNPGSPYYDSFVDKWAAGEYYKSWFMKRGEQEGDKLVWKMEFGRE
jgi:penicillin amidase